MEYVTSIASMGIMPFFAVNTFCAVVPVPGAGMAINVLAGVMYGRWLGTLIISLSCTLAAIVSLFIARSVFRPFAQKLLKGKEDLVSKLNSKIEKEALSLCCLLRISPVFPFPIISLAFGQTDVSLVPYALGSFAGLLPSSFSCSLRRCNGWRACIWVFV